MYVQLWWICSNLFLFFCFFYQPTSLMFRKLSIRKCVCSKDLPASFRCPTHVIVKNHLDPCFVKSPLHIRSSCILMENKPKCYILLQVDVSLLRLCSDALNFTMLTLKCISVRSKNCNTLKNIIIKVSGQTCCQHHCLFKHSLHVILILLNTIWEAFLCGFS